MKCVNRKQRDVFSISKNVLSYLYNYMDSKTSFTISYFLPIFDTAIWLNNRNLGLYVQNNVNT